MVVTKIMLLHQKKSKIVELETEEQKITMKLSLAKVTKAVQRKKLNHLKQN